MGMGHAPAFAVTVNQDDIEKMNFTTYRVFMDIIEKNDLSFDSVAQIIAQVSNDYDISNTEDMSYLDNIHDEYEVNKDVLKTIIHTYLNFHNEFRNKYNMYIYIDYHNQEDDGDRYDDIGGAFFSLDFGEVYQTSDNAKRLQQDIPFEISQFVVFG